MIADLGTRKGAKLEKVLENSVWINGLEWMRKDRSEFPVSTVSEIKLNKNETGEYNSEIIKNEYAELDFVTSVYSDIAICNFSKCEDMRKELENRYIFCNYIIDPNKFRLRKVVNILALVLLFIKNLKPRVAKRYKQINIANSETSDSIRTCDNKQVNVRYLVTEGKKHKVGDVEIQCKQGQVVMLHDEDKQESLNYFYRKSSLEIKQFLPKKDYSEIAEEKNGILFYNGRILPTQAFGAENIGRKCLSDVMLDLTTTSFQVPLVDYRSPFAFSLVNEVHWYDDDAKHADVETVLRYCQKTAHIIGGRELVKRFRKGCVRCRILAKRTLEVAMGPIKQCNLNIAPAFYMSQVDICGPLDSYSHHNRRATVKI